MPPINTPTATQTATPMTAWATLGAIARQLLRWVVPVAMVLALLQAAALLSLVLLQVPLAALFALATGTLARILGQRLKVKRLKDSLRAADLATFSFS